MNAFVARGGARGAAVGEVTCGSSFTLARTAGGAVCGGYNPKGWAGYGEYRPGLSAFLYTWPDGQCDESAPMTKLRKVGGAGMAQIDQPENGPSFGSERTKR